jgi:hypothetical protein
MQRLAINAMPGHSPTRDQESTNSILVDLVASGLQSLDQCCSGQRIQLVVCEWCCIQHGANPVWFQPINRLNCTPRM